MAETANKKNMGYIFGILFLSIGMQFANYGTAVVMSGEVTKMDAMQYYVLLAAHFAYRAMFYYFLIQ